MTVIVEVSGGVVVAVHGAEDAVVVDWDGIEAGDPQPELPAGWAYGEVGIVAAPPGGWVVA